MGTEPHRPASYDLGVSICVSEAGTFDSLLGCWRNFVYLVEVQNLVPKLPYASRGCQVLPLLASLGGLEFLHCVYCSSDSILELFGMGFAFKGCTLYLHEGLFEGGNSPVVLQGGHSGGESAV